MRSHFLARSDLAAASRPHYAPVKPRRDDLPPKTTKKNEDAKTMVMSWFPSWKGNGVMMPLRHRFLIDMATLLEADAAVLSWTSRDEELPDRKVAGVDLPRAHFMCLAERGQKAIRVVPRGSVLPGGEHEAHKAGFAAIGYRYERYAADDLKADPRLITARALLHERDHPVSDAILRDAMELCLGGMGQLTLGDVRDALGHSRVSWPQIVALASRGHLVIKLGDSLGRDTPILRAEPEGLVHRPEVFSNAA